MGFSFVGKQNGMRIAV